MAEAGRSSKSCIGTTASREAVASLMIGRQIDSHLSRAAFAPGADVLQVQHLCLHNAQGYALLDDLNFTVRAGEIVAIAGVSGNGQTELLEVLAGMKLPSAGLFGGFSHGAMLGTLSLGHILGMGAILGLASRGVV